MTLQGKDTSAARGSPSQSASPQTNTPMISAALLTSCPQIGRAFESLGPYFGMTGESHRFYKKCCLSEHPIDLSAEVRSLVAGCSIAIIGIHSEHREASMRTLVAASRSHKCSVVMTLEGYRGFIDFTDDMSVGAREFLMGRIGSFILIGDQLESFITLKYRVANEDMRHIGGLHWSDKTAAEIATFIRQKATKNEKTT